MQVSGVWKRKPTQRGRGDEEMNAPVGLRGRLTVGMNAFDDRWPAVSAQLAKWSYSSWGIGQAHRVLAKGGSVDDAVDALHAEKPSPEHRVMTREEWLHGVAWRQGLRLEKSGVRDKRARHFGTYGLYDPKRDVMVVGSPETGYGLSLNDVEAALWERRRRRS
jgi:hypothetical protein